MEQSAKYAYKVYEEKSFSAAAKSLFISQPALSQSITRLEKDLGFTIFDRKTTPMRLTPEGKIYIDSLKEIIESERIMRTRIKMLSDMECGRVSVGGSCIAAYHILAAVSASFNKMHPNVDLILDMGNRGESTYLLEKMENHLLDLVIGHSFSTQEYATVPIVEERYVIAMQKSVAIKHGLLDYSVTPNELISKSYPKEKEIEDISIFKSVEFLRNSNEHITGIMLERLIGEHLTAKCHCRNARHAGMRFNLMRFGLGADIISDTVVKMFYSLSGDLALFVPKSEESKQCLYMAYDLSRNITTAARKFLDLTVEMCRDKDFFINQRS